MNSTFTRGRRPVPYPTLHHRCFAPSHNDGKLQKAPFQASPSFQADFKLKLWSVYSFRRVSVCLLGPSPQGGSCGGRGPAAARTQVSNLGVHVGHIQATSDATLPTGLRPK
ncbi:hypothetical protein K523DRAFT_27434 [Schizophyllum commune Tattone D]|nr:hypothetical protein K523DRAFT_27434 [Schizophyllum commune Tattone D]